MQYEFLYALHVCFSVDSTTMMTPFSAVLIWCTAATTRSERLSGRCGWKQHNWNRIRTRDNTIFVASILNIIRLNTRWCQLIVDDSSAVYWCFSELNLLHVHLLKWGYRESSKRGDFNSKRCKLVTKFI